MPLTNIRLQNFKCFADSGNIPLAPLTVIFGRNNSGKSSILQSLLLLRQSLDSPEYGPRFNLRGPLYPAGTYSDIVHQHRSKEHIVISLGVLQAKRGSRTGPGLEFERPSSQVSAIDIECCSDEPRSPRLSRLAVKCGDGDPLEIRRGRGKGGPYELAIGGKTQGGEKAASFRLLADFLPVVGPEPQRRGRPSTNREKTRVAVDAALTEFRGILSGMRAVGAFRRQPERRYEYQGRVSGMMDATGEHVVDALIEDATRRSGRGELLYSVNQWLKAVGRVRLMPLRGISKKARIFELRLRDTDSGRWANYADVGFGIGQALPVIVEGLRTPQGGTFLVQEPEIHLHPDAQLAMADFLISLARSGRRVIAETHSEHILLRIRRAVAGGRKRRRSRGQLTTEDVSIIYVDKEPDGASRARRLDMDELGQIRKWPAGFMEEATEERMALMKQMAGRVESSE